MATRRIFVNSVPQELDVLRKTSKPVRVFDEHLEELLDDMKETLHASKTGVGLAGVQVGVLKRVFVIDLNGLYVEFVNPEIVKTSGSQCGQEGCLSVPNEYADVERPKKVTVSFYDRYGNPLTLTCEDFMARAVLHEYDHLNGVLYIDKIKK